MAALCVAAMLAMMKHTACPVHKMHIQDVHIKAGCGRIVVLPTFLWRRGVRPATGSPLPPHDISDPDTAAPADHANLFNVQGCVDCSAAGSVASQESLQLREHPGSPSEASPLGTASHHEALEPAAAAPDPAVPATDATAPHELVCAASHSDAEVRALAGITAEPVTQASVLAAWVRIVAELYLRDPSLASCAVPELRQAVTSEAIPDDARELLLTCTDEVGAPCLAC